MISLTRWCGAACVVCCGVVCRVVWCGVVWCGVVRCRVCGVVCRVVWCAVCRVHVRYVLLANSVLEYLKDRNRSHRGYQSDLPDSSHTPYTRLPSAAPPSLRPPPQRQSDRDFAPGGHRDSTRTAPRTSEGNINPFDYSSASAAKVTAKSSNPFDDPSAAQVKPKPKSNNPFDD